MRATAQFEPSPRDAALPEESRLAAALAALPVGAGHAPSLRVGRIQRAKFPARIVAYDAAGRVIDVRTIRGGG